MKHVSKLFSRIIFVCVIATLSIMPMFAANADEYLPASSFIVAGIHGESFLDKVDLSDSIFLDSFVKSLGIQLKDEFDQNTLNNYPKLRDYLANPKRLGIRVREKAYYFVMSKGEPTNPQLYMGWLIPIEDEEKILGFFSELFTIDGGETKVEEGQGFRYFSIDKLTVAWSRDMFLIFLSESGEATDDAYQAELAKIMQRKNTLSDKTATGIKEEWDACAWVDLETVLTYTMTRQSDNGETTLPILDFANSARLFMKINFMNGRAVTTLDTFYDAKKINLDRVTDRVNRKFLEYFPAEKLVGFFTGSIKPGEFHKTLRAFKFEGIQDALDELDTSFEEMGLSLETVSEALEGDFAISLSDVVYDGGQMYPTLVAGATVKNRRALTTFFEKGVEEGGFESVTAPQGVACYRLTETDYLSIYFVLHDDALFLTTGNPLDDLKNKKTQRNNIAGVFNSYTDRDATGGIYLDYSALIDAFPPDAREEDMLALFSFLRGYIDTVTMETRVLSKDHGRTIFAVNLTTDNVNSARVLTESILGYALGAGFLKNF